MDWPECTAVTLVREEVSRICTLSANEVLWLLKEPLELPQVNPSSWDEVYKAAWLLSADALVLTDAEGLVCDANPAYCRLFNVTRDELIGSSFAEVLPDALQDNFLQRYRKLFEDSGAPQVLEVTLPYKGTTLVIESRFAVFQRNGRRAALLSCMRDVTDDKQRDDTRMRQSRYEHSLAECSKTLLQSDPNPASRTQLLNEALEHLRVAARADRTYLFENFDDPADGFCSGIRAEAHAAEIPPNLFNPRSRKLQWALVPDRNRRLLASDHHVGGPVAETFTGKPEMIEWLLGQGIQSVLFLPIQFGGVWWGYIGLDDCSTPRQWDDLDVLLLRTAAEIFGSTLQRWQANDRLKNQYRYQQALAECSQILLKNPSSEEGELRLLTSVLESLREAVDASRAHILRNHHVPGLGLCLGILAEACAPGVRPDINNPQNQQFPWSRLPQPMYQALAAGHPFGGPVAQVLANEPFWLKAFAEHRNPLLSFKQFPIHFADAWWGLIGFDDVATAREWSDAEVTVLRTASEIIASALQRWQVHRLLEQRVQERTADLVQTNERLREEIVQRRRAEAGLAQRLRIEQTLTTLAARLLERDNPVQALQMTLRDLGQIVNARRMVLIYVDTEDSPFEANSFQWYAAGERPFPADLPARFPMSCPWLWRSLREGNAVHVNALSDLPPVAAPDRAFLEANSVDALVLFPMTVEGRLTAVLACSNFDRSADRQPDNLRILQLGAHLLDNMLRREAIFATLEQRVVDRTQELTTLFDITMLAGEAVALPEVLEPAIQRIAQTINCQAVCIHLPSASGETLTLVAQRGLSRQELDQMRSIPASPQLAELLEQTQKQSLVSSISHLPEYVPDAFRLAGYQAFYASQLRARGKTVGFLSAYRSGDTAFSLSQIALLVALADQLGIAVENHNLQRQTKEMAILGERQRLARELHDSITQSLYSQTLFARAGRYALEDGETDKVDEGLRQLESYSLATLKEMRLLLFQLRPFTLKDMSLQEAIEQRFEDVERRLGIRATCNLDSDCEFEEDTLTELYRVVMEALNNALKHANASRVTVELHGTLPDAVQLIVTDDGAGFEVEQVRAGMGLRTMRQRVEQIRGRLTINAAPGEGTQVIIDLPAAATLSGD